MTSFRDASIRVHRIGREDEPVAVIDNYFADPDMLVTLAAGLVFEDCVSHYPGHRAAAPPALFEAFFSQAQPVFTEVFGYGPRARVVECNFSLVTRPPERLSPFQRLPHFDSLVDNRLAVLIFLSPEAQGGTRFFRHVSTGFETITASRHARYTECIEAEVKQKGVPDPRYPTDGAPFFEVLADFEGIYNRALIYRGRTLHSGRIDDSVSFIPDPRRGRLTLNGFIDPAA